MRKVQGRINDESKSEVCALRQASDLKSDPFDNRGVIQRLLSTDGLRGYCCASREWKDRRSKCLFAFDSRMLSSHWLSVACQFMICRSELEVRHVTIVHGNNSTPWQDDHMAYHHQMRCKGTSTHACMGLMARVNVRALILQLHLKHISIPNMLTIVANTYQSFTERSSMHRIGPDLHLKNIRTSPTEEAFVPYTFYTKTFSVVLKEATLVSACVMLNPGSQFFNSGHLALSPPQYSPQIQVPSGYWIIHNGGLDQAVADELCECGLLLCWKGEFFSTKLNVSTQVSDSVTCLHSVVLHQVSLSTRMNLNSRSIFFKHSLNQQLNHAATQPQVSINLLILLFLNSLLSLLVKPDHFCSSSFFVLSSSQVLFLNLSISSSSCCLPKCWLFFTCLFYGQNKAVCNASPIHIQGLIPPWHETRRRYNCNQSHSDQLFFYLIIQVTLAVSLMQEDSMLCALREEPKKMFNLNTPKWKPQTRGKSGGRKGVNNVFSPSSHVLLYQLYSSLPQLPLESIFLHLSVTCYLSSGLEEKDILSWLFFVFPVRKTVMNHTFASLVLMCEIPTLQDLIIGTNRKECEGFTGRKTALNRNTNLEGLNMKTPNCTAVVHRQMLDVLHILEYGSWNQKWLKMIFLIRYEDPGRAAIPSHKTSVGNKKFFFEGKDFKLKMQSVVKGYPGFIFSVASMSEIAASKPTRGRCLGFKVEDVEHSVDHQISPITLGEGSFGQFWTSGNGMDVYIQGIFNVRKKWTKIIR
ncbi:hypothetical protein VP01_3453g1 [Puccinia sorghi]|uniref:Uncharacterized protein n=1 Tax=Puccinia sorghi TaxID=27349 RepID=A0A0L6UWZ9_9BASI|nr:hypothetical protein VP01_3453g1 [Puccinia sorghi]